MAEQLILPRRVLDANGDPLSGAKLYAYDEGTSTPETIYTDSTLATAHPSPLLSDAGGNFPPIWHAGDHGVKIAITDANDVALSWSPLDPCPATSSATSAANISFTPTAENPATNVQTAIENATTTGSPVSERSSNFTVIATDVGTVIRCTSSITVSLTSALTLGNGFEVTIIADNGDVTIDPDGLETINGAATDVILDGMSARIHCDGSAFYTTGMSKYTQTFTSSGYVIHPNGLIDQWMQVTVGSGANVTTAWPVAFPNAVLSINPSYVNTGSDAAVGSAVVGQVRNFDVNGLVLRNTGSVAATFFVNAKGH